MTSDVIDRPADPSPSDTPSSGPVEELTAAGDGKSKDASEDLLLAGLSYLALVISAVFMHLYSVDWNRIYLAWSALVCALCLLPLSFVPKRIRKPLPPVYRTAMLVISGLLLVKTAKIYYDDRKILAQSRLLAKKYRGFAFESDIGVSSQDLAGPVNLTKRFDLVKQIGMGGTAAVYLVRDKQSSREYVLKRSLAFNNSLDYMVMREAYIHNRLARVDSANIVRAHQAVYYRGGVFLLMDYVAGFPMSALLQVPLRYGIEAVKLDPLQRKLVVRGLVNAVKALQAAGVVYRDFSHRNVLIARDSLQPILIDFDWAVTAEDRSIDQVFSEPIYKSYEAVAKGEWTPATDVWSVAVLLSAVWTGDPFGLLQHKAIIAQDVLTAALEGHMLTYGYPAQSLEVDFLRQLYQVDPEARLRNFADILSHPYFAAATASRLRPRPAK